MCAAQFYFLYCNAHAYLPACTPAALLRFLQCVVPPWLDDNAPPAKRGMVLAIFYTAIPAGTVSFVCLRTPQLLQHWFERKGNEGRGVMKTAEILPNAIAFMSLTSYFTHVVYCRRWGMPSAGGWASTGAGNGCSVWRRFP